MVERSTRQIALKFASLAASIACAFFGGAAMAQPIPANERPDADKHCPTVTERDFPEIPTRDKPLVLPKDWHSFADSSVDWIAVRTDQGMVECIYTTWLYQAEKFEKLSDRFVGFEWTGYEAWGYVLVDTAGTGSSMDTGARPTFSPDGTLFAALQSSDAGWGGFEGFGVWRTFGTGMMPLHVDTSLPFMADWRIDRWEGGNCIHMSAIPHDRIKDWDKLAQYARDTFVAGAPTGWKMTAGSTCPTY